MQLFDPDIVTRLRERFIVEEREYVIKGNGPG